MIVFLPELSIDEFQGLTHGIVQFIFWRYYTNTTRLTQLLYIVSLPLLGVFLLDCNPLYYMGFLCDSLATSLMDFCIWFLLVLGPLLCSWSILSDS